MPARPGYPVSPGGAPAVFKNTRADGGGAELDSSASPRLRGDLGLRGCTPHRPGGEDVGTGYGGAIMGRLWGVRLWGCWGVIMGRCVWCGGSVALVFRGCFGEAGV